MAILTAEQKKKYLAAGAQLCPFCESENISGDTFDAEGTEAWQRVMCSDCLEDWQDVYKLADVETQDELEADEVDPPNPERAVRDNETDWFDEP
jgi:formate dehydrogenase maturation protein FdhE